MTSRQRVLTAIRHREPDRVPFDYWAAPEVTERLLRHFNLPDKEALLQRLGVDLRTIPGPSYAGQELKQYEDGSVEDLWGVRRKRMTVERGAFRWSYKHVVASPLAEMETAREVDRYKGWPSPDWWDYSTVKADCERQRRSPDYSLWDISSGHELPSGHRPDTSLSILIAPGDTNVGFRPPRGKGRMLSELFHNDPIGIHRYELPPEKCPVVNHLWRLDRLRRSLKHLIELSLSILLDGDNDPAVRLTASYELQGFVDLL